MPRALRRAAADRNSAGLQIRGTGLTTQQDTTLSSILSVVEDNLSDIEGGFDHAELMRALVAGGLNRLTYVDNGDGTYTATFRDISNSKVRITMTGPLTGGRLTSDLNDLS